MNQETIGVLVLYPENWNGGAAVLQVLESFSPKNLEVPVRSRQDLAQLQGFSARERKKSMCLAGQFGW
jgi:hypothetical protein